MKKVLIFTAREGHLSLSQASCQALKKAGFRVQLVDLLSLYKLYTPFYRYFPFLFKIPYQIGRQETVKKGVKTIIKSFLTKKIKEEIKTKKPDLIISTHPFYNPAIAKVLDFQKTAIPFINIVANPWAIHPLELSQSADLNLVYDKKGVKAGRKNNLAKNKVIPLGWLIRNQFYNSYNREKVRKELGFKKNIFTLLICGGSEGTNMILKILPGLLTIKKPLQIIVVCGTNKGLFKAVNSFKKIIKKLNNSKINSLEKISSKLKIKPLKFTNQLPQLITASNLVVGKAGPNLLFETVACQKPFLAICHISGQEDDNLNLIKKKKLGFVEENPLKAIKLLNKIINQPQMLERLLPKIDQERSYNLQAQKKLTILAKSLFHAAKTQKK